MGDMTSDGADKTLINKILDNIQDFAKAEPIEPARCRMCGCTEDTPCANGCTWVPDPWQHTDLCSACLPPDPADTGSLNDEYGILDDGKKIPRVISAESARKALEARIEGVFAAGGPRPARLMWRQANGWREIPGEGARDV